MLSTPDLVEFEAQQGDYRWYSIEPKVLYPNALREIFRLGYIKEDSLIEANIPRDRVTSREVLERRNLALELARKYFTQELVRQMGNGSCLHILNDPQWRL